MNWYGDLMINNARTFKVNKDSEISELKEIKNNSNKIISLFSKTQKKETGFKEKKNLHINNLKAFEFEMENREKEDSQQKIKELD